MCKKALVFLTFVFSLLMLTLFTQLSVLAPTTTSLEYVLSQRKSIRDWTATSVSDGLMKTVCKSAFSSGFDLSGITLYCVNSTACYQYSEPTDSFTLQVTGDIRSQLASVTGMKYIENAPRVLIIVWDNQKLNYYQATKKAGIIIQNLYLIAIRYGLGGVSVGAKLHPPDSAGPIQVQSLLGLSENLKPMLLFPVGYPTEPYATGDLQPTLGNLSSPLESEKDLLEVLKQKNTLVTAWRNVSLSQQKLSNLLWSMYGYSLLGTGHRTTPTAFGDYGLQIYVFTTTATYNYTPSTHSLIQINSNDKRATVVTDAGAPAYMKNAPALLVLCWNKRFGTHKLELTHYIMYQGIMVGLCLQNLYLSANAWDVGISEAVYTTNYDALRKDIADPLPSYIYPMYLVGAGDYPPTHLTLTCHTVDSKGFNIKTHVGLWNQTGSLTAESDTDESGWCTFWGPDTGNYTIKVTFQGIPVNNTSVSLNQNVTIALCCQIYYLTVTVNDQYNKAIHRAEVTVHWPNGTAVQTLRTDENGLVTFPQLPIGSYIVTSKYGEQSSSQKVTLDKDKTISIQVTFPTPTSTPTPPTPTPTPTPPGFPTAQLLTLILLILLAGLTITYIIYRRFRKK